MLSLPFTLSPLASLPLHCLSISFLPDAARPQQRACVQLALQYPHFRSTAELGPPRADVPPQMPAVEDQSLRVRSVPFAERGLEWGRAGGCFCCILGKFMEKRKLAPLLSEPTTATATAMRGFQIQTWGHTRRVSQTLSEKQSPSIETSPDPEWGRRRVRGEGVRGRCAHLNESE